MEEFARQKALPAPVPLVAGLALLPLRDEEMDSFLPPPLTGWHEEFASLTDQLMSELGKASRSGRVMYFETDYFGGPGGQGAVVMENENVIYGPVYADIGPINAALALLGVTVAAPARDEFETVGLDRHRSTEDWLELGER